jgi:hypothetical protein
MQAFGTALLCSILAAVCYRSVGAHARLSPCLSRISTRQIQLQELSQRPGTAETRSSQS